MNENKKRLSLKYCGARSREDCETIADSSADMIGFIFAPSKRKVEPVQVKSWHAVLPPHLSKVGVFQDQPASEVAKIALFSGLDIIQCHGSEEPEQLREIKQLTSLVIYKALKGDSRLIHSMRRYEGSADGYIVDSVKGSEFGGTGTVFDWRIVPQAIEEARRQNVPLLVAGGITAENAEKLLTFGPDGLDVSSGIENGEKKCKSRIQLLERVLKEYEKCEHAR